MWYQCRLCAIWETPRLAPENRKEPAETETPPSRSRASCNTPQTSDPGIQRRLVKKQNSRVKYIWKTLSTIHYPRSSLKVTDGSEKPSYKETLFSPDFLNVFNRVENFSHTQKKLIEILLSIFIQLCTWNATTLDTKYIRDQRTGHIILWWKNRKKRIKASPWGC